MSQTLRLYDTHIGKKAVMALSGVALVGFVVAHIAGNLQVFLGAEVMAEYAAGLRRLGPALWIARIGLLVAVVAHAWSAVALMSANADARPVAYQHKRANHASTFASRTMRWGGPILALLIVYHLAHLTFGKGFSDQWPYSPHNPYNNLLFSFRSLLNVGIYSLFIISVAFHTWHGVWSMLQSLGLSHPRYNKYRKLAANAVAALLLTGGLVIPWSVFASSQSEKFSQWSGLVPESVSCAPELATKDCPCDVEGSADPCGWGGN